MCVKNTAAHNVGVLSAEWFVSLKGSLIKVSVLWFRVCWCCTRGGSEPLLQTTLTGMLSNYSTLLVSHRHGCV